MASTQPQAWPLIAVTINDDGRAEIDRLGTVHTLHTDDPGQARDAVRAWIGTNVAQPAGRAVPVTIDDPDGLWHVQVTPAGDASASEHGKDRPRRRSGPGGTPTPAAPSRAQDPVQEPETLPAVPADPGRPVEPALSHLEEAQQPTGHRGPLEEGGTSLAARPRAARHSFLDEAQPAETAETGWRGLLARVGISLSPSPAEHARRDDERAVSQHWAGPRTIAVVNGKGGAGKTPTTVILSALLARYGGSGVLAWDNNETRGTLGWRTEQGTHEAHVLDLLPHAEDLMAPTARASDLAAYVHHQRLDKFDVLRSNPEMLAAQQRLTADDFDAVHGVGTKYFRLIFVDSGNDESAPNWLRMIDVADQVVVAITTRPDHAEAGILLLDALRGRSEHTATLADNALVVVSQADKEEEAADRIAAGYDGAARSAVTIPYDKAMRAGWLRFDNLAPATRRAWLRAAAEVARGL